MILWPVAGDTTDTSQALAADNEMSSQPVTTEDLPTESDGTAGRKHVHCVKCVWSG